MKFPSLTGRVNSNFLKQATPYATITASGSLVEDMIVGPYLNNSALPETISMSALLNVAADDATLSANIRVGFNRNDGTSVVLIAEALDIIGTTYLTDDYIIKVTYEMSAPRGEATDNAFCIVTISIMA